MRVAFTIVLNNLKMLKKQVEEGILKKFDYWVIIEGAAGSSGSTAWCNTFPEEYHDTGISIDGTHEYLLELAANNDKVKLSYPFGKWESKDEQVNHVFRILGDVKECMLWEIDVDEFWNLENLKLAEFQLKTTKSKAASFLCDYLVGNGENNARNLIVKGGWGEGNSLRYNRLFHYVKGDQFLSHEPPIITGQTSANTVQLPYRFTHFAYTDRATVEFKDKWYGGHAGILEKWEKLNEQPDDFFPAPITELLPDPKWNDGNTYIHVVKPPVFDLYIQWFRSNNLDRNAEIIKAIRKNSANPYIRKIVVFAENEFDEVIDKVHIVKLGRRMTYLDCFQHIKYVSDHDGYFIIANSDIIFPEESAKKFEYQDVTLDKAFVALSRYDYIDGTLNYVGYVMAPCSQDTWIFKKKDIDMEKFQRSNFYLGVCSCDNIIARVAHDAGLKVKNPSLYVKTVHLHESRFRTYANNSGLHGLIAFINPADNLDDTLPPLLSHSVWENPIFY